MRRKATVITCLAICLTAILMPSAGLLASDTGEPVAQFPLQTPTPPSKRETWTVKTDVIITVDNNEVVATWVEVTVSSPTFSIPDTERTRELLQSRTYHQDTYWVARPEREYWYAGPMDGSQFYCQYFPDGSRWCYEDFSDEAPNVYLP